MSRRRSARTDLPALTGTPTNAAAWKGLVAISIWSYAFGIKAADLHPELTSKGRIKAVEASHALDEFARHIKARQIIPQVAAKMGIDDGPEALAIHRLRLSIACLDGEKKAGMSDSDLMKRVGYLFGVRFANLDVWQEKARDMSPILAQKISGICGVEYCWVIGAGRTDHSSLFPRKEGTE